MSAISFVVHGVAQPAGSKRGFVNKRTGAVIITDAAKKSRPWKAQVSDAAAEAMFRQLDSPLLEGPLALVVRFYMPRPKGHYGAKGVRPSAPKHPAVRPDTTKLLRAIEDACNGIVWRDDAQIVSQYVTKAYGEPARVHVQVNEYVEAA